MATQALANLYATHSASRIAIHRRGQATPLMVQQADANTRAFIHPIHAPDGDGTLTENAPPHHPWQHGLYVGLNDVNGIGFWTEGLRQSPSDGSFHPRPLAAPVVDGANCQWQVTSEWRAPDGALLLIETQAWSLDDRGASYDLDLQWTLTAVVDLAFGRFGYGGLFVRMPYVSEGSVINSSGQQTPAGTEAQRAAWVAIAMPLPDRHAGDRIAGLAMMDHPGNPGHPVPWRVDGQLGISPSRCISGPWTLAAGASSIARHRVFIHTGSTDVSAVASSWNRFIN